MNWLLDLLGGKRRRINGLLRQRVRIKAALQVLEEHKNLVINTGMYLDDYMRMVADLAEVEDQLQKLGHTTEG